MRLFRRGKALVIVATLVCLIQASPATGQEDLRGELGGLVGQEDEAFLLSQIQRIGASSVLRQLAAFQQSESTVRGDICSRLPNQFIQGDSLPESTGEVEELEAAVALARHRHMNQRKLKDLGFPVEFSSDPPPRPTHWPPTNVSLTIDWRVPEAFLAALENNVVSKEEIAEIVGLPANRELLRYSSSREGVSGHPVTEDDLAFFVSRAGSPDPLNRLWCWLNPMNLFGYADLVANAYQYRSALDELKLYEEEITDAVLTRIAPFVPPETEIQVTVALSVCCPMSGWTTSRMVGVNVEHLKGGWEHMVRTLSAAVFRRFQQQQCLFDGGPESLTVDDLADSGSAGPQSQVLECAINMTVFEGTVDYVADLGASDEEERAVELGVALLHRYATGDADSISFLPIDTLALEEKDVHCSLCALGRHMARVITAYDGPQAITELVERGPATFIIRAAEIESVRGRDLLSEETVAAIRELAKQG
ncbi:MAG: hypothetical protein OQK55_08240 [Thermoanaerobaculales bacterium]|nr:hypothetical protein [Thermoanaerobaculales bacterium]